MKKLFIALLMVMIISNIVMIPAECVSLDDTTVNLSYFDHSGDKIAVAAKQGDTVEIVTAVNNVKGLNGLLVKMCYDSNLLSYEDSQKTNLGRTLINTDEENLALWSIMFSASGTDINESTEVNVLKFKAKADIATDNECFYSSIEEFYDVSYTELSRSCIEVFCRVNGQKIEAPKPAVFGDANNDGKVTNADALTIIRHAIKVTEIPSDRLARCDVNGDGKVTSSDALQITRYCVGYKSKYPIGQTI